MSKRLTDEELQAIREREAKATAGEWRFVPINDSLEYFVVGEDGNEAVASGVFMLNDAAFIAHARQDIPKLLAEIEYAKELLRKSYKNMITQENFQDESVHVEVDEYLNGGDNE